MNTSIKKEIMTEDEILVFAATVAKSVQAGSIIFLEGPLGVGKTTFMRGFLRSLGYLSKVKSPTYTLVEPYEIAGKKIFHFDLYRLNHADELEPIGIRDYFTQDSVCIIEWPEKGFPLLPGADLVFHIKFHAEGRMIIMEALSDRGRKMLEQLR